MSECIDRQAAIEAAKHAWAKGLEPTQYIEMIPAADVAPVVHGRWEIKLLNDYQKYSVTCSICGWVGTENYDSYDVPSDFNYCPNCGAKMDLENEYNE